MHSVWLELKEKDKERNMMNLEGWAGTGRIRPGSLVYFYFLSEVGQSLKISVL